MNAPHHTPAPRPQGVPPPLQPQQWAVSRVATLRVDEAQALERFSEMKAALPSRAARRMSRLGLMLARLLEQTGVTEETTVIYGSTFAEGRTLETYLESFPQPSPLGFQSSIHPSGIEQVLILRQQPVRAFFPLADDGHLPLALLRTLLLSGAGQRALLLGGEECASWLTAHKLGAAENFAFALALEPTSAATATAADPPLAMLRYQPAVPPQASAAPATDSPTAALPAAPVSLSAASASPPAAPVALPAAQWPVLSLSALCDALAQRSPLHLPHPDGGCWTLDWC